MKESITIKNLGPLVDCQIDEIMPLTVVIGESGSGKSALMKVISLFRWLFKMQNIRSYLSHSGMKSPFRFRMESYLGYSGLDEFVKGNTEITYSVTGSSGTVYSASFKSKKLSFSGLIKDSDIAFTKISFIPETRSVIPMWADKGARMTGNTLGFYFQEVFNDFELATERVRELPLHHLHLNFSVRKTSSGKKYKVSGKNGQSFEIDFLHSSSGTQTSAPVLLIARYFSQEFDFESAFNRSVLSYLSKVDALTSFKAVRNLGDLKKRIFVHIEEPELSLFPDAQCDMMASLLGFLFEENTHEMSLFVSTHSPYIINFLNLIIRAYDKNAPSTFARYPFEQLGVYMIVDGSLQDLKLRNERLINTNPLADTINSIYDQYNSLG